MSGRDGKNIDSTDNAKRGQKKNKSEKVGMKATFLPYEGVKKIIFHLRGVKNVEFDHPTTTGL